MQTLLPYLKLASERRGSDLFFTPGAPPMLKIDGEMHAVGRTIMNGELLAGLAAEMLTPEQLETLGRQRELDCAIEAAECGRFRANLFYQRGQIAFVLRVVRSDVPRLDDLGVPEVLKSLMLHKRGLILVVGAAGSGKSTTLAGMINHRNEEASGHILTIEDPIEFVHPNLRSIVNQREVGQDTLSYDRALVGAMREAPDVILIGEIRTRETMDACVQLANTGHLALSTLHANNAPQALQRIVNLYPQDRRDQLYLDLSLTLRAIVSQRLVRRRDGRRCAAVEVLMNTPLVQDLIQSRRIDEIRQAMDQSSSPGMQTFDQSLYKLYTQGLIELDEALDNADSRTNLEAKINFGA
jgi:twitching motility protein PilU